MQPPNSIPINISSYTENPNQHNIIIMHTKAYNQEGVGETPPSPHPVGEAQTNSKSDLMILWFM